MPCRAILTLGSLSLQGPAKGGQRSVPCSAMELASVVHGASLPSQSQSTAAQRTAQGSSKGAHERPNTPPTRHQRGRVLPTSASLGRLTVPSSLRALPEPSSEPSVTGPCPDLPSSLRQLAELRSVSACELQAQSVAHDSCSSGSQIPSAQAAPVSAAAEEVEWQSQAVAADEGCAEQEACSSSEQHSAAVHRERAGKLPFASRVQLHGQVLCKQLYDEKSPIPVRILFSLKHMTGYCACALSSLGILRDNTIPGSSPQHVMGGPDVCMPCRRIQSLGEGRRTEGCSPALSASWRMSGPASASRPWRTA